MGKSVEIQFEGDGGKVRRLRYDFNAISELEERLNVTIGQLMAPGHQSGFREIRGFLWAGLKWENRALTPEKIGELIQQHINAGGELSLLMDKATQALQASGLFGVPKEEGAGPTKEAGEKQAPTSDSMSG